MRKLTAALAVALIVPLAGCVISLGSHHGTRVDKDRLDRLEERIERAERELGIDPEVDR